MMAFTELDSDFVIVLICHNSKIFQNSIQFKIYPIHIGSNLSLKPVKESAINDRMMASVSEQNNGV